MLMFTWTGKSQLKNSACFVGGGTRPTNANGHYEIRQISGKLCSVMEENIFLKLTLIPKLSCNSLSTNRLSH